MLQLSPAKPAARRCSQWRLRVVLTARARVQRLSPAVIRGHSQPLLEAPAQQPLERARSLSERSTPRALDADCPAELTRPVALLVPK